jgi:hypothetical protein
MADPRRIGILTFHRCINYGSYWQARCLAEGLAGAGHTVELLDHDDAAVNAREWHCAFQPGLPTRTPRRELPAYKAKGRKFLAAFDELPLSPRFPLGGPDVVRGYDAVVVGSDEVWNFRHPWYSGASLFWGDRVEAERLVSYAASFGNHDAADGMGPEWAERLDRFSAISVRDDNSRALVDGALGTAPPLVLDPVLQFPDVARAEPAEAAGRYALIYGHGLPDWLAARVRRWADASGTRLVSIGYSTPWADEQWIDAGPAEFASAVAGAQALVTNFFHGCVFALANGKPFAAAPSEYRANKIRDLVAKLDARHRVVEEGSSDEQIAALLNTPIEPDVSARIDRLRASSQAFLDAALA